VSDGPKGRSISRRPMSGDGAPPPVAGSGDAGDDRPAPLSPFAGFGPDARTMTASAESNRSQSLGILAIVGGVVFSTAAALVVAVLVLLLYLGYRKVQGDDLAANDPRKGHVRDTGSAGPIEDARPVVPGRPRPGGGGGDGTTRDPSMGPPPGPATVIVSKKLVFLSIEVNCPGGYRSRGTFREDTKKTMRATVQNVPGDERCTVTFQGSQPAKAWITGNQTLSCTFEPVVCHEVY
jgi:hypothetical protein